MHALGAADEHDVALAALDRVGELVDEQLRAVAADGRHRGRLRRDTEAATQQRAGIGVRPGDDLHDRDDVGLAEQRGTRVGLGRARGVGEEFDR